MNIPQKQTDTHTHGTTKWRSRIKGNEKRQSVSVVNLRIVSGVCWLFQIHSGKFQTINLLSDGFVLHPKCISWNVSDYKKDIINSDAIQREIILLQEDAVLLQTTLLDHRLPRGEDINFEFLFQLL